jgi:sRNA-binding regulator protein Hfq
MVLDIKIVKINILHLVYKEKESELYQMIIYDMDHEEKIFLINDHKLKMQVEEYDDFDRKVSHQSKTNSDMLKEFEELYLHLYKLYVKNIEKGIEMLEKLEKYLNDLNVHNEVNENHLKIFL